MQASSVDKISAVEQPNKSLQDASRKHNSTNDNVRSWLTATHAPTIPAHLSAPKGSISAEPAISSQAPMSDSAAKLKKGKKARHGQRNDDAESIKSRPLKTASQAASQPVAAASVSSKTPAMTSSRVSLSTSGHGAAVDAAVPNARTGRDSTSKVEQGSTKPATLQHSANTNIVKTTPYSHKAKTSSTNTTAHTSKQSTATPRTTSKLPFVFDNMYNTAHTARVTCPEWHLYTLTRWCYMLSKTPHLKCCTTCAP